MYDHNYIDEMDLWTGCYKVYRSDVLNIDLV